MLSKAKYLRISRKVNTGAVRCAQDDKHKIRYHQPANRVRRRVSLAIVSCKAASPTRCVAEKRPLCVSVK